MSIVVVVVVVEDAGVDSHGSSVSMLMGNGTVVGHHDSGPDISQLLCGGHGSMVYVLKVVWIWMFVSWVVVLVGLGLPGDVTLFSVWCMKQQNRRSLVYFWFL